MEIGLENLYLLGLKVMLQEAIHLLCNVGTMLQLFETMSQKCCNAALR